MFSNGEVLVRFEGVKKVSQGPGRHSSPSLADQPLKTITLNGHQASHRAPAIGDLDRLPCPSESHHLRGVLLQCSDAYRMGHVRQSSTSMKPIAGLVGPSPSSPSQRSPSPSRNGLAAGIQRGALHEAAADGLDDGSEVLRGDPLAVGSTGGPGDALLHQGPAEVVDPRL